MAGRVPAIPGGTGRILGVLRKLINYGQELARTVWQRDPAISFLFITMRFRTRDIALIRARITRALRLAGALGARLVSYPII